MKTKIFADFQICIGVSLRKDAIAGVVLLTFFEIPRNGC